MTEYVNECVGCPPEIGCKGNSCPYRNVKHLYCDKCGYDFEELYLYEDLEICEECLLHSVEKITLED